MKIFISKIPSIVSTASAQGMLFFGGINLLVGTVLLTVLTAGCYINDSQNTSQRPLSDALYCTVNGSYWYPMSFPDPPIQVNTYIADSTRFYLSIVAYNSVRKDYFQIIFPYFTRSSIGSFRPGDSLQAYWNHSFRAAAGRFSIANITPLAGSDSGLYRLVGSFDLHFIDSSKNILDISNGVYTLYTGFK